MARWFQRRARKRVRRAAEIAEAREVRLADRVGRRHHRVLTVIKTPTAEYSSFQAWSLLLTNGFMALVNPSFQ